MAARIKEHDEVGARVAAGSSAGTDGFGIVGRCIQIFHLKIHDIDRAILRLKSRALRENRPDDTSEEVIRRRIRVYHEQTAATLKAYDPAIIFDVDADQSPLAVHCDIVNRLRVLEERRLFHSSPGPDDPPDTPDADSLPAPAASR